MPGNTVPSKQKRKELAEAAGRGVGASGFKFHQGAKARGIGATDEQSPTLTADWHNPAVFTLQSDGKTSVNSNGSGYRDDDSAFTLNTIDRQSVAFAQNTRDEVRLVNGDGEITGALGASGSAKGQGIPVVIASGQANAEIAQDGTAPTVTTLHEAPIVIDRAAYNQGRNAQYPPHVEETELMDTLTAQGPHAVGVPMQSGHCARETSRESGVST